MTHQQRTAVSIVTGPNGAHAPSQLPDGDLFVGHDVSKVGAHLWKKHHAERPPQALSHWELPNITPSLSHYCLNPKRPSLEVLGPKAEPDKEEG